MATPVIQKSFNSGEWAPQLYSRVDLEKYKSGAALLQNFFVDYRGGASTRTGTQYILQAWKSQYGVRLIPFRASTAVAYVLEFGQNYIRFYYNKAPILETTTNSITGITKANPGVITVPNLYAVGDVFLITGVVGMTQLNGNYYQVLHATATTITLADLNGNSVDTTSFGTYTSGGTVQRVYTIYSPYLGSEVFGIKYAQNVNTLVLCHPNHPTMNLTLITFNNWLLYTFAVQASSQQPSINTTASTLASGSAYYAYVATAIGPDGDESSPSAYGAINGQQDIRSTAGSNSVTINALPGITYYNFYRADISYFGAIPAGVPFGYIGQLSGGNLTFIDSNIQPDFSIQPPIYANPFAGLSVVSITVTAAGTYTTVPAPYFTGGTPTIQAVAFAVLTVQGTPAVSAGGSGYVVGDEIYLGNGVTVVVATLSGSAVATVRAMPVGNPGSITGYTAPTPSNPVAQVSSSGAGTGASFNLTWGVGEVVVQSGGSYASNPAVHFDSGAATAVSVISDAGLNNPQVPGFFQQRLCLAAAASGPETLNFSQPGSYQNFNVSSPIQADDAISVTLSSGQLETIKSLVPTSVGLIIFTDQSSWLMTGGSLGSAISPSAIVANRQSLVGANDLIPIVVNFDVLYGENKGSAVRDANYNYYAQIFTGTDISAQSSHLFYGYELIEWTWAFAPFRVVWAVRDDGVMLTLTFAREEDFVAWSHQTTNGLFKSVTSVPEVAADGMILDAVYTVVQRTINGNTVQYIERFADRIYNGQAAQAWTVDAGIQYSGSPASNFSGAQQLAGATVTGLADGNVIPPFTMPVSGSFSLSTPASLVTVGLAFTPQLQTLPVDVGEPTIQGRQKKISSVVVRCVDTLGLSIGSDFDNLVPMQDLVVGNVGSMTNEVVTDLVTGDAMTIVDPKWAEQGQFCIEQTLPLPATITGVIPRLTIGDTAK